MSDTDTIEAKVPKLRTELSLLERVQRKQKGARDSKNKFKAEIAAALADGLISADDARWIGETLTDASDLDAAQAAFDRMQLVTKPWWDDFKAANPVEKNSANGSRRPTFRSAPRGLTPDSVLVARRDAVVADLYKAGLWVPLALEEFSFEGLSKDGLRRFELFVRVGEAMLKQNELVLTRPHEETYPILSELDDTDQGVIYAPIRLLVGLGGYLDLLEQKLVMVEKALALLETPETAE